MNVNAKFVIRHCHINYVAPVQRSAVKFWRWWSAELLELLPTELRQVITEKPRNLFAQVSGDEFVFFVGLIDCMQEIGRRPVKSDDNSPPIDPDGSGEVVLLLPPDQFLETRLTLPAATEENLRDVLGFEMDQISPFSSNDVYYDFIVAGRSPTSQTIDVDVFITRRDIVDRLVTSLRTLGLRPRSVSARNTRGGPRSVNLLPVPRGRSSRNSKHVIKSSLAAAAIVLLIAVATIPLIQKHRLIGTLEPQVTQAMEAANEGAAMRRDMEEIIRASRDLVLRKESQPMLMRIVDEMTKILPDDTWVTRLDVSGSEIQIQGQSRSAASLIGIVESSALFESARFRSPVTQVPQSDVERFHLSANWSAEQ